tara:strand:- start:171 stop:356 length:186 start_codon:yes stop_codon:yes gene_type:complete
MFNRLKLDGPSRRKQLVKEKRRTIGVDGPFGKDIKKIITREKLFRSFKEGLPLRSKTEQRE